MLKFKLNLISDAHEWINEIPTVPIYYLAKPQQRERTLHLFPTPAHRNQRLHSLANIMFVIALADSDLVISVFCMSLSAQADQTVGVRKTLIL